MTVRYSIEEFDPTTATDDDFRARWEHSETIARELAPEDPPTPFEQYRKEMLEVPSHSKPLYWVAWDGDRKHALGSAGLDREYTESNRHLSWFGISVDPDARRQRIGTDLLARIVEAARDDSRTILGGSTVDGQAGDAFAVANGFDKKMTDRKSRLHLADVDRARLESWVEDAKTQAAGYELVAVDGPLPDDLLEPFVAMYHVTNTAPRDDLDMEDRVETPERFRERQELDAKQGYSVWRVIVRHAESGEMAGFTEFWFLPHSQEMAWQGWTAVVPSHRGKGLGRWLKAVNCLRLMDERPEVADVYTDNAFSNGPMLAINIDMGFELLRAHNMWQAPVDRLAEVTKERLGR
ncbi:MAG TPA: GNAT family N-acetyltransferase [Acidimicrobiales bacterium]